MSAKKKMWMIGIISVLICSGLLFITILNAATKLPNENWSKGLEIKSVPISEESDLVYAEVYDVVEVKEKIYFMDYNGEEISIDLVESNGERSTLIKYKPENKQIEKLYGLKNDEEIEIIFETSNQKLYSVIYDSQADKVLSEGILVDSYDVYKVNQKALSYMQGNDLYVYSKGKKTVINNLSSDVTFLNVIPYQEKYLIDVTRETLGVDFYEHFIYDRTQNKLEKIYEEKLAVASREDINTLVSGVVGDEKYVLTNVRDSKFKANTIINYKFDLEQLKLAPEKRTMKNSVYELNALVSKDGFIISEPIVLDKIDVSYKNRRISNLKLYDINFKEISLLTKRRSTTMNPRMAYMGEERYLFWQEYKDGELKYLAASNNQEVINKSRSVSFNMLADITFLTFFNFAPIFLYIFIILALNIYPSIILFLIINFISLTWCERNPKKLLYILTGVHLLKMTIYFVRKIVPLGLTYEGVPMLLNTSVGLIISFIMIMGLSIYFQYLIIKNTPKSFAAFNYIKFALFNSVFVTLYFMPYLFM